jgi:hypothetical protein
MIRHLQLPILALACAAASGACTVPECAHGDFSRTECRVQAEGHYARLLTSTGVEVRFQAPDADSDGSWQALGLLEELEPGLVRARVATLGDFALTVDPGSDGAPELTILLQNVARETRLTVGPIGEATPLPDPAQPGIERRVPVVFADSRVRWVRGVLPCEQRHRVAVLGDVQTNPVQFERIVEALHAEASAAAQASEPLLGLLLAGDLSESTHEDELRAVDGILRRSPVPVSVTTGNHDVSGSEMALFNRMFGPGNYAFSVCGTRVVVLDTGDGRLAASVEGRLPEMLQRPSGEALLAVTHYPPHPGGTGGGWGDDLQAAHVMAELVAARVDLVLAGHVHAWHEHLDLPVADGRYSQVISGTGGATQGLGLPRYGFTRVVVGPGGVEHCFREIPAPGDPETAEAGPRIRTCPDG